MSKKPTKTTWAAVKLARDMLALIHPGLFDLESPVPFKIGFSADIRQHYPEMPRRVLETLLKWLTSRRAYYRACVIGADRMGFDGPCGTINESHAQNASERLARREFQEAQKEQRRRDVSEGASASP